MRNNNNKFSSEEEEKYQLIDNYYPVFYSENFESIYLFNSTDSKNEILRSYIRFNKK